MRRTHNVAILTLVIIAIVYLFAQPGESLAQNSQENFTSKQSLADQHHHSPGGSTAKTGKLNTWTNPKPVISPGSLPVSPPNKPSNKEGNTHPSNDAFNLPSPGPPAESSLSPVQPDVNPGVQGDKAASRVEVEFPFQNDLPLELSVDLLRSLANHHPHNYDPDGPKTYAFATFMATHNPSLKDPYYLAIHSLIYRLLWAPRSKTSKYPLVVFVAPFVTAEQRTLLSGAGAVVRELPLVEWEANVPNMQKRWRDQFSKLNMWKETEFARIAFLDADAFPLSNLDDMFNQASARSCDEAKLSVDDYLSDQHPVCENFVFAGVPQDPFNPNGMVNGGLLLFTPSKRMHQRLLQNYLKMDRYDVSLVEQGFLGWQFSHEGAFPATPLAREWGAFFPQEEEEGKLKVVHEKIWVAKDGWMQREWQDTWIEMSQFYMSPEFMEARTRDGTGNHKIQN